MLARLAPELDRVATGRWTAAWSALPAAAAPMPVGGGARVAVRSRLPRVPRAPLLDHLGRGPHAGAGPVRALRLAERAAPNGTAADHDQEPHPCTSTTPTTARAAVSADARRPDGTRRALRIGLGGPVGSGKTATVAALCRALRDELSLAVVTNDIYTREDAEFLLRDAVLPPERITAVETGACPHTAIRDDISANLEAVEDLEDEVGPLDLVLVESGGDNLTATFSKGLVDAQIFVIDVAGGDDIPRKGGPGVTTADLLVVNKTDLAPYVGSDLGRMAADAKAQRGELPVVFQSLRGEAGVTDGRRLGAGAARRVDGMTRRRTGHRADRRPGRRPGRHRPARAGRATGRWRCAAPGRTATEARVMLVGAMSGPLGGDRLAVEAEVGEGARLHRRRRPRPPSRCPAQAEGRGPLRRTARRRATAANCAGCPSS